MLNATVEKFISEYFLMKAILGKHLPDGRKLFGALSKICLIPEADVSKLYALAENEAAKSINTEKEFMQHQRMQKYSKLVGSEQKENAEWEEIIAIKGSAIQMAMGYNLVSGVDVSRNAAYSNLSMAASGGTVAAMQIMGILLCEGIFLDKNKVAGLKYLEKAAGWNDIISILALLHYSEDNRGYNMARLRQVLENTPYPKLYKEAAKRYGTAEDADCGEVRLLLKAFASGILKREVYDPKYARILNSKALYIKDKEKTVFSPSAELLSVIGSLPLKLTNDYITAVDVDEVKNVTVKREAETKAVIRALRNGDLRELPSYRPLCICSDSRYMLNMFAKAIAAKSKGVHVETIEVGELIEYDFEPSPNNVFIRSIDEDKDNRFLMFFCGDIPQYKIEAVKSMLQSGRRAKFHLNSPNVTLNLGMVLPICFCDKQNAELLRPYCDIVRIAPITEDELAAVIRDILIGKEKLYGVGKIKLSGEPKDVFCYYDIDTAEKLIDSAVRARREKGAKITLSREILEEYNADKDRPRIGFGGYHNGRNQ